MWTLHWTNQINWLSVLAHILIRNTCPQAAFEKMEQLK